MINKPIFLAIIFLFICAHGAQGQVSFESILESDQKQVMRKFPKLKPSPSLALADRVIKYLMQTDRYEKIYLLRKKGHLVIRGEPSQIIGKISSQGNRLINNEQVISIGGIFIRKQMDRWTFSESVEKLKKYYNQNGYLNAQIKASFKRMSNSQTHLKYSIDENAPCLIEKINIRTLNKELEKKILSGTREYKNKRFSNHIISEITNTVIEVFRNNRYISSQIIQDRANYNKEKTRVTLTYRIKDPYKYEIYVSGNQLYTFPSILRIFKVKEYQGDSVDPVNNMRLRLLERYKNKGFAQIKISYNIDIDKESSIKKVIFKIDEGPQVKIHRIEVIGKSPEKSKSYAKFIRKNSSKLITSGYYKSEDIKKGKDNLITHLRNQGYLKARHISTSFRYINRGQSLGIVSITINEGPLTLVGNIKFTGIRSFSKMELIDQTDLRSGSPLHFNKLEQSLEKIKGFYADNGFLETQIVNEDPDEVKDSKKRLIQFKNFNTRADLNFIIHEGPKIKVASIVIKGNDFTRDYVVLKEIYFDVGDTLTPEKVYRSQQALHRLGVFSQVDINMLEQGVKTSRRTVVIRVRESNPGIFKAGVGLTNERGLTGRSYVGVNYNNIKGAARSISGRLDYNTNLVERGQADEVRATAGYLEPYLFHSMWRGRINSILKRELRDDDDQAERYVISKGLELLLENDLTEEIKFTWTLWSGIQRQLEIRPKPGSNIQREALSQLNIAQMGPSFNFEYRDNPFLPTKGHYGKLSALYANPNFGSSKSVHFLKVEGNYRYYLPIGRTKWVWANSYSTGYIKDFLGNNGESGIPYSSFFFLGGHNSIRGFGGSNELERIPNSDALDLSDPNSQTQLRQAELIRTEEVFYTLIRSELRFPIKGAFGGVIFYDAGEVNMSDIPQTKSWRQSFGVGLRLNSPFGPVVLDYARKVQPLTGIGHDGRQSERRERIHISIGTF